MKSLQWGQEMKGNGVSHTPTSITAGYRAKVMDSSHTPLLQSGNHEDADTCKPKPFFPKVKPLPEWCDYCNSLPSITCFYKGWGSLCVSTLQLFTPNGTATGAVWGSASCPKILSHVDSENLRSKPQSLTKPRPPVPMLITCLVPLTFHLIRKFIFWVLCVHCELDTI